MSVTSTVSSPPDVVVPAAVGRTRVVVALALAWLGFVALHRVASGRAWWWGAVELVPPLAFLLVPIAGLALLPLARRARRRVVLIAALAVALGAQLAGLNPAALWHTPPPAPAQAFTVFSWNTWYWDQRGDTGAMHPPPGGTPAADADHFYRYLRTQDADVYLLQEYLYVADDLAVAVDDLPRLRREFPGYRIDAAGELITLSRLPVVGVRRVDLTPFLPPGDYTRAPADSALIAHYTVKSLRTDVLVGGRAVSLYNTHIHAPVEPAAESFTPRRLREAHALRRAGMGALAADLAANPQPAFVSGDFNTSPAMGLLRELPTRLRDLSPALASVLPGSWDDRLLPLWRIDWAYATPELTAHRYALIPSEGLSDHRGQSLTLSLG